MGTSGQDFPEGLKTRGRRLWTALGQEVGTAAGELALEACRVVDRLEQLDDLLIAELDRGLLTEARQQALALKTLLAPYTDAPPAGGELEGASPLAQILALVQAPGSA